MNLFGFVLISITVRKKKTDREKKLRWDLIMLPTAAQLAPKEVNVSASVAILSLQ